MASSSSQEYEFDVFLSFRGEDIRKGFIGHLYEVLTAKGIFAFLDSEKLHKGTMIDELFGIIKRSEIFIPVFSKGYADSTWCLREIAEIIECDRLILPIFYDVDPSEVRKQTGSFQKALLLHQKNKNLDKVTLNVWRSALRKAGKLSGYVLNSDTNGHEAKLIQIIVKGVIDRLKWAPLVVAGHPIGIGPRVEEVMRLLQTEANDVRIVGIHGMGGIGKTTISKAIYNSIRRKFDGASFIFNIAERSKQPNGLVDLQKQLINHLFNDDISSINITASDQGISIIRRRVAYKKILLVLDDVDHRSQLKSLAERTWFCPGSRVLITTRNDRLLNEHDIGSHEIYRVKELDESESLRLFCYHAFRSAQPPEKYFDLSKEAARASGGLPLALEVHGSLFFDLNEMELWEEMLGKLRRAPHDDVQKKLKVSYDGLTNEERLIFLDIACFFIGKHKDNAMQMWKNLNAFPNLSIKVLEHKSLIKINSENGEFEMHDVLRELGRDIVRQECPSDPWLRSRLWDADEILNVLQNPREKCSQVEAIMLKSCTAMKTLRADVLSKMPNLRLLQIHNTLLEGHFLKLPKELNWLELTWCRLLFLEEAVDVSERGHRRCHKVGLLGMNFCRLSVLNLSNCESLASTPDFSGTPCLVKLTLDGCLNLMEVHVSIKHLKLLKFWSMRSCTSLKELPAEVSALSSLEILNLSFCFSFETLPEAIGGMKALRVLILDNTRVKELPNSVTQLKRLSKLSLKECMLLIELPDLIGKLESLKDLIIASTRLEAIPNSIGDIGNLQTLDATSCTSLSALPESIGRLKNLRWLKLGQTGIQELPDSIGFLEELETMFISGEKLEVLPSSFGRLRNLVRLEIPGRVVLNRPENLMNLQNLMVLNLRGGSNYSCSWDTSDLDFENLPSLKSLILDDNHFNQLPLSIGKLSWLEELSICWCSGIHYLPQLPSSLTSLSARYCTQLKAFWDVSNLKHLRKLDLSGCSALLKIYGPQHLESIEEIDLRGCRQLEREFNIMCQKEEEDLQWSYISNPNEPIKLIIEFSDPQWWRMPSIGVLVYAMVGQEVIFESPRMADEYMCYKHRTRGIGTSEYAISIEKDDELCKYIGDIGTSLHVRLGLQDLRSRRSERTEFKQLRQFYIASGSFSDSVGEEEKIFFSFMIPKSQGGTSQVYIREVVIGISGEDENVILLSWNSISVHLRVMVEGKQVFETTKDCDNIKDFKEDVSMRGSWQVKFGVDDAIHRVFGRAPAVLHVSTCFDTRFKRRPARLAPDILPRSRHVYETLLSRPVCASRQPSAWAHVSVQYSSLDYYDEAVPGTSN